MKYLTFGFTMLINTAFYFYLNSSGLSRKEIFTPKRITIFLITWILLCIGCFYEFPLKTLFSYAVLVLMVLVSFPSNFKERILNFIIFTIYGLLVELGVLFILRIISDIDIFNMPIITQFFITIIYEIIWIMTWMLLKKIPLLRKAVEQAKVFFNGFIGIEIISIIFIAILSLFLGKYYNDISAIPNLIAIILIIVCAIIIISVFSKHQKTEDLLKARNEFLQQNIEIYEKSAENYRVFKHNILSDLITIKSVANKEAQEVIDLKMEFYEKSYSWVSKLSDIPNGLRGVISMKIQQAREMNIQCLIESNTKKNFCNNMGMKRFVEVCDIINIIINNAIEAASKCRKKYILISIEDNPQSVIKIINPFKNSIDINDMGNAGYSTKGKNRGIGLFFIRKYKSKKIKIDTEVVNNLFITKIILK